MNMQTYDQVELNKSQLGEEYKFLKENLEVIISFYEGEVLGLILPDKIVYTITKSEPGVKGNTTSTAMKDATLENGMTIKVPMFIEEGENILVSTADGKYVSRA
jgi:elongation factor P